MNKENVGNITDDSYNETKMFKGDCSMATEYWLSSNPSLFAGKKPLAVIIDGERIPTNTWQKVYEEVLQHCIKDPVRHKLFMELSGRILGQQRLFISASPDKMSNPLKISEGLYADVLYGSQTLMHILTIQVLEPLGYDYSKIKIEIK